MDATCHCSWRASWTASAGTPATKVLELTQAKQTFRFINVGERPVPSLLRNFSAPVIVEHRYSDAELAFLSAHDSDGFNRWEAGQRLAIARLMSLTDAVEAGRPLTLDDSFITVLRATLLDVALSPAFKAQALLLPAESFIGEQRAVVDPEAIREARRYAMRELGQRLASDWHIDLHLLALFATNERRVFTRRRVGRQARAAQSGDGLSGRRRNRMACSSSHANSWWHRPT